MTEMCPTSLALLNAGEEMFAEKGFEATSIRDLAAEASVNIAAINYHFQSKDNLYREVLLRCLRLKREAIVGALERFLAQTPDPVPLPEVVRTFVRAHVQDMLNSPHGRAFFQLMSRELNQPRLPLEEFFAELVRPVFAAFSDALRRARPQLTLQDIAWIQFNIVGQVMHCAIRWRAQFHRLPDTAALSGLDPACASVDEYIRKVVDHVTVFSTGGIEALLAARTRSGDAPSEGE